MIIAITGGSGFIGETLVKRYLEQNAQVRLLSRQNSFEYEGVHNFVGDLSNPNSDFIKFVDGADILYHCAGEINDESMMHQLHVNGTQKLIEASLGRIGRLVILSSVGAYGVCNGNFINENSPENPSGIYEKTKTEADTIVKNSGIPYVILRPSNIFGSEMRNQSLFKLVKMIKKGFFFFIGKKGALVNYIHVDDVVKALLCCGNDNRALNEIFILSQTTTVENMVNAFLSGLNIDRTPIRAPELPIRLFAKTLEKFSEFPLTISRIDALTGYSVYNSNKIIKKLDYDFLLSLEISFVKFASDMDL